MVISPKYAHSKNLWDKQALFVETQREAIKLTEFVAQNENFADLEQDDQYTAVRALVCTVDISIVHSLSWPIGWYASWTGQRPCWHAEIRDVRIAAYELSLIRSATSCPVDVEDW